MFPLLTVKEKNYDEKHSRVHLKAMMTPSKIWTKIRCIITCCVRGNIDEDVDGGCNSDDDYEWTSFNKWA